MLPQEEQDRIKYDYTTPLFRQVATIEAYLWYERMGKFAESSKQIVIDGVWWTYRTNSVWVCNMVVNGHLVKKSCTTPELINEFLKIK